MHLDCDNCVKKMKLVFIASDFVTDKEGNEHPRFEYYQCEICSKRFALDIQTNTLTNWEANLDRFSGSSSLFTNQEDIVQSGPL